MMDTQSLVSSLQSLVSSFRQDRRGASLVTYAFVLPLFILIIFGAGAVWQIISIKQSLDLATYEAARYLSQEGRDLMGQTVPYYDKEHWETEAHARVDDWIREQVRRNTFVSAADGIDIQIAGPPDIECNPFNVASTNDSRDPSNIRFTITTRLTLDAPVRIPYMEPFRFTLQEGHSDIVECPRFLRDPPEEGNIF